ncbi:riboflavin synthase [Acidaminococcus timonensis]|uniref:riboflavin synthase n=1 Tax=Acidaminococcus timonensis TaxID=1871002 RepID=UPI003079B670
MFTGLIAELGKVEDLRREQDSYRLTISAEKIPPLLKLGESVCCNGACLTVTKFDSHQFTVDVMPETARRTTIGSLKKGDRINLERTLHVGDGLDGHIVSGHVDGVGTITRIRPEGIAKVTTISCAPELLRHMEENGTMAIEGISLTIPDVTDTTFSVSLFPLTVKWTTLGFKKTGDKVNLETDILGKYVERMLEKKPTGGLTRETLFENGFF